MKVVILMGGIGSRFASVGYTKPKPLLLVDGKPMIEHVVSMYPGDHEYIFVCNNIYLESEVVRTLIKTLPHARMIAIPSHTLGPVHSLSFVWDELGDEPVLVSYCDFNANWDFADFARRVGTGAYAGAIPSYTGFHPHLLHKKKYAGILANPDGRIERIQEKHSFTENPEESYHSAGNYYFSSAEEMRHYAKALIDSGNTLNGEYYVSMVYYHYLADQKDVLVYPLKHFLQWGTPEDLEEYEAWSQTLQDKYTKGQTDIPLSRQHHIQIPYTKELPEYQQSEAYWREYFTH